MNHGRQIFGALLCLLITALWFEFTPTDLWLQRFFYDSAEQRWIWSGAEPITRLLLYDGLKRVLIVFAVGLAVSLAFTRRSPTIKRYASGIRIVLFSLILVPATVAGLKETTNVSCPRSLAEFGGNLEYVGTFQRYPEGRAPPTRQRCFPAGHASAGFALLALFFLFELPVNRRRGLYFGLAVGWVSGGYKMLIGDHFLSHTVTTMLLAWLIVNAIALAENRLFR